MSGLKKALLQSAFKSPKISTDPVGFAIWSITNNLIDGRTNLGTTKFINVFKFYASFTW